MGLESEYLKCAFEGYLKTKGKSRNWLAQKKSENVFFILWGRICFLFRIRKKIHERNNETQTSEQKPIPIDPAVDFLNECIQQADVGDHLNDRQKQALLKIIRDELKSACSLQDLMTDRIKSFECPPCRTFRPGVCFGGICNHLHLTGQVVGHHRCQGENPVGIESFAWDNADTGCSRILVSTEF